MENPNVDEIARATNKIIYEIQDYSSGTIQSLTINWEVKTVNAIDVLTPNVSVNYQLD